MTEPWTTPTPEAVKFLHKVCSAGQRCECAIGSSLWYSANCVLAREHALIHAALTPPEPTEAMVEAGAHVMADLPTIDAPKLDELCWRGSVRAILVAALRAMPLQQETKS